MNARVVSCRLRKDDKKSKKAEMNRNGVGSLSPVGIVLDFKVLLPDDRLLLSQKCSMPALDCGDLSLDMNIPKTEFHEIVKMFSMRN